LAEGGLRRKILGRTVVTIIQQDLVTPGINVSVTASLGLQAFKDGLTELQVALLGKFGKNPLCC
jgi:hypothetical protein